jgi:hypothetical protein
MPQIIEMDNKNDIFDNLLNKGSDDKTKSNLEVLKELFTETEIRLKTELPINAVILVNQKRAVSRLMYWNELDEVLSDFMCLMVSKDRKGRAEFVDAFKSEREVKEDKGFLTSLKEKIL